MSIPNLKKIVSEHNTLRDHFFCSSTYIL